MKRTSTSSLTAPGSQTRGTKRTRMHPKEFVNLKQLEIAKVQTAILELGKTAGDKSNIQAEWAEGQLVKKLAEFELLEKELEELKVQEKAATEEENERNSVTPSSLDASNLHRAAGGMHIHNRDSGVARHRLFYNVVRALASDDDSWKEMKAKILDGIDVNIKNIPDVDDAVWVDIENAISYRRNQHVNAAEKSIEKLEVHFSEGLSRDLTTFCAQHELPFIFSHQFPCSAKGTAADIAAFSQKDDSNTLLGLIEVKIANKQVAKYQLCGYLSLALNLMEFDSESHISFGLTIDPTLISIYGFLWSNTGSNDDINQNQTKPLLEHSLLWSEQIEQIECGKLLKAYMLCLFALSDRDLRRQKPLDGYCPLVDQKVNKIAPKVFREDSGSRRLCKLFDYGRRRKRVRQPNVDILKKVYGTDISVELLSDTKSKVDVLRTPWFDGVHEPPSIDHMILLCKKLEQLHREDIKHGDVLKQNIVFGGTKEGPWVQLIDFDYSHLKKYPANWNINFRERHPDAREGQFVEQLHDVYAVIAILCTCFEKTDGSLLDIFSPDDFGKNHHPVLTEKWRQATASTLAGWIAANKETIILRADEQNGKQVPSIQQTGSPQRKKPKEEDECCVKTKYSKKVRTHEKAAPFPKTA